MKKKRKLCLALAFLFICLNVCSLWAFPSAVNATEIKTIMGENQEPMPCDNITLTAYLVPLQNEAIRDKMLKACKDADIDMLSHIYVADEWVATDHTYDKYKTLMEEADKYGMKLLTRAFDVQSLVDKADDEIRAIANTYKSLPGFGGFYVVDEPYDPNPYARVVNILREVCPEAEVNVNFLPRGCYPEGEYEKRLLDFGGLIPKNGSLSLDVYAFGMDGGVSESGLFTNYEDLRKAALATGQNSAVYVQSVGLGNNYRRPSADDLRYNMMAALAYGIKNIKFFTWGTPPESEGAYTTAIFDRNGEPTDLYEDVCLINKKIHKLGTTIAACDAVNVYHSSLKTPGAYETIPSDLFVQITNNANVIISLMKERCGDGEYIMVVNKNFKAKQTVTLSLKNVDSVQVMNCETGKYEPATIKDGTITLELAAGDAGLIKLPGTGFFPDDNKEKESKNLALNASVMATSSLGSSGYFLSNVTDGVTDGLGARLTSNDGSDQSLIIDLGSVEKINRVDFYPSGTGISCGQSFPSTYTISVSSDGVQWTTVVNKQGEKLDKTRVPVFRFDADNVRYVCVTVKGFNAKNKYADLGEIAVYLDDGSIEENIKTSYVDPYSIDNINVALQKPVIDYSSTIDQPAWSCHHTYLTDGNPDTAWASAFNRNETPDSEEWIVVDLLDVYNIDRVELVPREVWNNLNVFPSDYEIQVSSDGENFTTVASVEGDNVPQTQNDRVLNFAPVAARYVKLLATRLTPSSTSGAGYTIEMSEMKVFCTNKTQSTGTETTVDSTTVTTTEDTIETSATVDSTDITTTDDTTNAGTTADKSNTETTTPIQTDVTANTTEETTEKISKTGCKSIVGEGSAIILSILATVYAVNVYKRKREEWR